MIRMSVTIISAAIHVECSGVSPKVAVHRLKSPAPAKPPTLQKACIPLIIRLPAACSTKMAWIFTTTSIAPMKTPKDKSPRTANGKLGTSASTMRMLAKATETTESTLRQPNRVDKAPDSGIVRSEPIPIQSSSKPRTSSAMPSRCLKSGTRGAHVAAPNPPIKNMARVAYCVAILGFG